MRSLGEIIETTLTGGKPEYDELRYALCAMQALSTFDMNALAKLAIAEKENKKPFLSNSSQFQYSESFNRKKWTLKRSPKEYLGLENDPDNPEYQESRKWSQLLLTNVTAKTGYMGDVTGVGCDPSTV
jgi:hypothetical protein